MRERAVGKPELTDNYEFTYKKLYAYKIATSGVFAFTAQIAKVLTIVALFSRLSHAQEGSVSRTPATRTLDKNVFIHNLRSDR